MKQHSSLLARSMQSLTHSCVVPRVCVQRTPNALNPIAGEAEGSDKKRRKAAPKPKAKARAKSKQG